MFDRDEHEPVRMSPQRMLERLDGMEDIFASSGNQAHLRAWQEVGYIISEDDQHLFSAEEVQAVFRRGATATPTNDLDDD